MNKRKKAKIPDAVLVVVFWVEILLAILFAMAAGAACYHQYLMQKEPEQQESMETKSYTQQISQSAAAGEEIPAAVLQETPDDLEAEAEADELELMAVCVEAEAGNQDLTGKRMVVDVILNRVDDPDFPDTITEVITQKYAFSSYWDGGMDRVQEPSEETIRAVQMELEERGWPGILYFTAGEWPAYGTRWKKVGDHYFNTK